MADSEAATETPVDAAATTETPMEVNPNAVDISPNKDGGVLKEIKVEGSGDEGPCKGDRVFVHYVGTLLDGSKFDSSRDRDEQFEFTLGTSQVIKAWDIGVATMKRGELCVLTAKPEYAYGDADQGKIPPNSTLVFEVELFDWKGEDVSEAKDDGVIRSVVTEGEGYDNPNEGATVQIHIIGRCNKVQFQEKDVEFTMGEACESGIVEGVEMALKKFKKGETSKLVVKAKYAYGELGCPDPLIAPNSDLEFEVTLKNFEKAKEFWEMDDKEKLEQAELYKQKGTNFFKAAKYELAIKEYKKITDGLTNASDFPEEESEKCKSLKLAGHLNLAMCYLKMKDNLEAKTHCDSALEVDPKSVKGYFRRGTAKYNLQDYREAIEDFKKAVELDPNNKAAKTQITLTQKEIKKMADKEKQLYGGMFQKFAEMDEKLAKQKGKGDEVQPETEQKESQENGTKESPPQNPDISSPESSSCESEPSSA
eukprot:GHVU01003437.1.p1 GENE.GHVU01003437.1~~GHVU01003437.1.p1  ORF type:complete len:480 (-),score=102.21 GHVU01003437.1:934-2373(-)